MSQICSSKSSLMKMHQKYDEVIRSANTVMESNKHSTMQCSAVAMGGNTSFKTLVCYTPVNSDGTVSCLKSAGSMKSTITTDNNLAVIPSNSIIDTVEFFGTKNFSSKDDFSIGLGQLNQGILFPLIIDTCDEIANERIGGCRQFISDRTDGRTDKSVVATSSFVNVSFHQPQITGYLTIVIHYHTKPT